MTRLEDYVARLPFLRLIRSFDNCLEALELLRQQKIDLIFLDIEIDGFSGIQFLEAMSKRPAVILTTAFDQYALKAFDLNVTDYLLKPYSFERFVQAVGRVEEKQKSISPEVSQFFIFVKTEYRLQKISLNQILYIEGMRDYRRIHLETEKIMTLETFGDLERKLPPPQFCRVHKSFMVSVNKIESIERERITVGKALIPLSETYRSSFYELIGR